MIQKFRINHNQKGFTLIELMIVIAIIGILAAIAIPNFIAYRKRGYDAAAKADVKNAYTAAQAYFTDWPDATMSDAYLSTAGFLSTAHVTVAPTGGQTDLQITSKHDSSLRTYTVNSVGTITDDGK